MLKLHFNSYLILNVCRSGLFSELKMKLLGFTFFIARAGAFSSIFLVYISNWSLIAIEVKLELA